MMGWRNVWLCALTALLAAMFAAPAAAQSSYTVNATTAGNFGNIAAAATGTTVFRISTANAVSVVSGSGGNVPSGTKAAITITIRCTSGNNAAQTCTQSGHNIVSVRVGPRNIGANRMTGLQPSNFTTPVSANISNIRTGTDGALIFDLTGFTNSGTGTNQNQVFSIGFDQGILGDNSSTATTASGGYYVSVLKGAGGTPAATGTNNTFSATVRRNITITKVDDLVYGNIRLPTSPAGNSTITMATNSDTPTAAGGVVLLAGGVDSRAEFTVTGQASTTVAFSISGSPITLTSGANTLSSTLTLSATTGTLSAGGTLTVFVGGALTVPNNSASGAYSGAFTFTANYN